MLRSNRVAEQNDIGIYPARGQPGKLRFLTSPCVAFEKRTAVTKLGKRRLNTIELNAGHRPTASMAHGSSRKPWTSGS